MNGSTMRSRKKSELYHEIRNQKSEIRRYRETNENEDITIQKLWDTGKAIPRGKFTALQAYVKKKNKKKLK